MTPRSTKFSASVENKTEALIGLPIKSYEGFHQAGQLALRSLSSLSENINPRMEKEQNVEKEPNNEPTVRLHLVNPSYQTPLSDGVTPNDQLTTAQRLSDEAVEHARRKNFDTAKDLLTKAIKLDPRCASLYGNRSLVSFKTGEFANSLADAKVALELASGNVKFLNRKAWALIELGKFDELPPVLAEIRELKPKLANSIDNEINSRKANVSTFVGIQSNSCTIAQLQIVGSPLYILVSHLPKSVNIYEFRDLIANRCSVLINAESCPFFDEGPWKSCLLELESESDAKKLLLLQNFPFGLHSLNVKFINKEEVDQLYLEKNVSLILREHDLGVDFSTENNFAGRKNSSGNVSAEFIPQISVPRSGSNSSFYTPRSQMESPKRVAIFIGNLHFDVKEEDLLNFVSEKLPGLENFSVVKKEKWDYGFVNLENDKLADMVISKLHRQRFANVLLDVHIKESHTGVPDAFPQSPPPVSPDNCTSLYFSQMPDISLHEFLNFVYCQISSEIKSDFAAYRQIGWNFLFLNFESPCAAATACRLLNESVYDSTQLQVKLQGSKTFDPQAVHRGYREFHLSLQMPSEWLRIDNLDGVTTEEELRKLFEMKPIHVLREIDFSVAYILFPSAPIAQYLKDKLQGEKLHKSKIAIRYATLKK